MLVDEFINMNKERLKELKCKEETETNEFNKGLISGQIIATENTLQQLKFIKSDLELLQAIKGITL